MVGNVGITEEGARVRAGLVLTISGVGIVQRLDSIIGDGGQAIPQQDISDIVTAMN